jgi:hypothetical protein
VTAAFHLPTACYACDRSWLALPGLDKVAACPSCGRPTEVVPGESYQVDDVALFERLEGVVRNSQLTRLASHRLWAILSDVTGRARRPELLFVAVVDAMPALRFLETSLPEETGLPEGRAHLVRAAGMILVILTAHLRALDAREAS